MILCTLYRIIRCDFVGTKSDCLNDWAKMPLKIRDNLRGYKFNLISLDDKKIHLKQ